MRATVCLPTYNERENLEPMVHALGGGAPRRRPRARDRRQLAGRHGRRSPTGSRRSWRPSRCCTGRARRASALPTSPASGARSTTDAELILEMDCDFSHDPTDVPRLIEAVESGADLALGSRYVAGRRRRQLGPRAPRDLARRLALHGALPADRRQGPDRRLQVLPPPRARDDRPRRDHSPPATPSRSRRPTAHGRRASAIVEVPIAFDDRTAGHSKMSRRIVLEAVWRVPLLLLRR